MGRTIPLLCLRASAIICAGLLLFAVFAPARAGSYTNDDYGLSPLPPASQAAAATATTYNGTSGYTPAPGQYASGQYAAGQPASLSAPSNAGAGFTPAPGSAAPAYQQAPAYQAPGYQQPQAYQQPPAYQQASGYQPAPSYQAAPAAPVYQQPLPAPGYTSPVYAPSNSATPPLQSPPYPATAYVAPGAAGPGYGYNPQTLGNQPSQTDPGRAQMIAQGAPAPQTALRQSGDATTPYGYNRGDGEDRTAAPGAGGYYQPSMFQTADNSPRANPDYVLGTGDKIHLSVFDEADLSGDYTVDGSGYVRLPLIGQVRAAGYTPPQLEAEIGSALANGYLRSPRVSVEVATYRPFYVVGAVGRPGQYAYVNHMTVMNAIAMAGGFLPSAVQSSVYVRHEGSPTEYRLDTDRPNPIRPGDVLRVDTTVFWDAMSLFSPLNGVASIAVAGIR